MSYPEKLAPNVNDARLPDVFATVLAAEAAWEALDRREHPHSRERRFQEYQQAKDELAQQYPDLAAWLFGWSESKNQQRRAELLRLLQEVIERAQYAVRPKLSGL